MIRFVGAFAVAVFAASTGRAAETLIVTLSTDEVSITSNFTGARLTVFGAIEGVDASAGVEQRQIVIVLRGPKEDVTTRRTDRLLGLWINQSQATLHGVPSYYALHTTAPLAEIASPDVLAANQLGLSSIVSGEVGDHNEDIAAFEAALVRLRQDEGLYYERQNAVVRPSASIFQTAFDLPAQIAVGEYDATVYLFRSGQMIAFSGRPMEIVKTGAGQFIFDMSRGSPWLYALAVVLGAALAGWLGGFVFRRD